MQNLEKCQECQNYFDTLFNAPLILPCQHIACQQCLFSEYKKQNTNKCSLCQVISKENPIKLQKAERIISELLNQELKMREIEATIDSIRKFEKNFKQIYAKLTENKSQVLQEIIRLLYAILFQSSKQLFTVLEKNLKELSKRKKKLISAASSMKNYKQKVDIELIQGIINTEQIKKHKNKIVQQYKQIQEYWKQIVDFHKELLLDLNSEVKKNSPLMFSKEQNIKEEEKSNQTSISREDTTKSIQQVLSLADRKQVSQSQNLVVQQSLNKQEIIEQISCILWSSSTKIDYDLKKNKFATQEINIVETNGSWTQIEQLKNQELVISGAHLYSNNNSDRFIIYQKGLVQQFQMPTQRGAHRTVFDLKDKIYIFSGCNTEKCEVFDLQNSLFQSIADIPQQSRCFGAFKADDLIYVTGGGNNSTYLKEIQLYNITNNSWTLHSQQLPEPAKTTSAYIQSQKVSIIYFNYYNNKETLLFDFNSIVKHGNQFQTSGYVFSQPLVVNQKTFQFNDDTELFCYEFSKAKWEKLE